MICLCSMISWATRAPLVLKRENFVEVVDWSRELKYYISFVYYRGMAQTYMRFEVEIYPVIVIGGKEKENFPRILLFVFVL